VSGGSPLAIQGSDRVSTEMKGRVLVETELLVDPAVLEGLRSAIGTPTAEVTASLVPFFGPTLAGQDSVIGPLGLDLRRTLQGGQSYEWHRPFRAGERVRVTVEVEDILQKQTLDLVTVTSVFRGDDGDLIQRQRTVFVQRRIDPEAEDQ